MQFKWRMSCIQLNMSGVNSHKIRCDKAMVDRFSPATNIISSQTVKSWQNHPTLEGYGILTIDHRIVCFGQIKEEMFVIVSAFKVCGQVVYERSNRRLKIVNFSGIFVSYLVFIYTYIEPRTLRLLNQVPVPRPRPAWTIFTRKPEYLIFTRKPEPDKNLYY